MVNSVNMLSNEETCSFFSWYEKKIIKMSDKNWNGVVVVFCLSASQTFGSCGYDSAVVRNYILTFYRFGVGKNNKMKRHFAHPIPTNGSCGMTSRK